MYFMKLRLILGGCILCVLGVALIVVRGYSTVFLVLPIVGVVLLVDGLLWMGSKGTNRGGEETGPSGP
jgi:membrane-bound ClpP family serine protease